MMSRMKSRPAAAVVVSTAVILRCPDVMPADASA
jgi:hypothetical protein